MYGWVRAACMIALLAMVAIPLSNLLVSQDAPSTMVSDVEETGWVKTGLVKTGSADTSAVSALVSGTAVGPARGALLNLRHPASAFVP